MIEPLSIYIIVFVWRREYHSTVRQETKHVNVGSLRSKCQDTIR